jgi:hypothetical protein
LIIVKHASGPGVPLTEFVGSSIGVHAINNVVDVNKKKSTAAFITLLFK